MKLFYKEAGQHCGDLPKKNKRYKETSTEKNDAKRNFGNRSKHEEEKSDKEVNDDIWLKQGNLEHLAGSLITKYLKDSKDLSFRGINLSEHLNKADPINSHTASDPIEPMLSNPLGLSHSLSSASQVEESPPEEHSQSLVGGKSGPLEGNQKPH